MGDAEVYLWHLADKFVYSHTLMYGVSKITSNNTGSLKSPTNVDPTVEVK